MSARELQRRIAAEAARWAVGFHFEDRGKHKSIVITAGDRSQFVIFSGTKICARGDRNAVAQVRRTCVALTKGLAD